MAARVEEDEVLAIMPDDTDDSVDISAFITPATLLVDRVAAAANADDSGVTMSDDELKEVERWLAAHFYAIREMLPSERKLGDAAEKFQGKTNMHLDATIYGQQAKALDATGELARLGSPKTTFTMETINPESEV